jgi:DNA-binding NarL/FixJ family response regulator
VALVRVLLADDHAGVLAYVCERLGKAFEVIGSVEDGKQAVDAVLRLDPDVVVLDISMPVLNGFQVTALLREARCRTKIVILTIFEDSKYISAAFSSGANAYVSKRYLAADLEAAINAVLRGSRFISPAFAWTRLPFAIN